MLVFPAANRTVAMCKDVFPPDKFNAGVIVLEPNLSVFQETSPSSNSSVHATRPCKVAKLALGGVARECQSISHSRAALSSFLVTLVMRSLKPKVVNETTMGTVGKRILTPVPVPNFGFNICSSEWSACRGFCTWLAACLFVFGVLVESGWHASAQSNERFFMRQ